MKNRVDRWPFELSASLQLLYNDLETAVALANHRKRNVLGKEDGLDPYIEKVEKLMRSIERDALRARELEELEEAAELEESAA